MRLLMRFTATAAALAASAGMAACGGSDGGTGIPREQGQKMLNLILEIESDVNTGTCEEAVTGAAELRSVATGLRANDVGGELRDALIEGTLRLETLVGSDCSEPQTTTTEPTTTEPTTTEPTTTTTTETTEPTTTTETTETTTTDSTEEPGGGLGPGGGGSG